MSTVPGFPTLGIQIPFSKQTEAHSGFPFQSTFITVPYQSSKARNPPVSRWVPPQFNFPTQPPPRMNWIPIKPGHSQHQMKQVQGPSHHRIQFHGVYPQTPRSHHTQAQGVHSQIPCSHHSHGVYPQSPGFHQGQEPKVHQIKIVGIQSQNPIINQQRKPIQSVGSSLPRKPQEGKKVVFDTLGDVNRASWQHTLTELIQKPNIPSGYNHGYTSGDKSILQNVLDFLELGSHVMNAHSANKEFDRPVSGVTLKVNGDTEAVRRDLLDALEGAADFGKTLVASLLPTKRPSEADGRPIVLFNSPNIPKEHVQIANKPKEGIPRPAVEQAQVYSRKVYIVPTITTTEKNDKSSSNPIEVENQHEEETTEEKIEITSESTDIIEKVTKKPWKDYIDETQIDQTIKELQDFLKNGAAEEDKENNIETTKKPNVEEVDISPSDDDLLDYPDSNDEDEDVKTFKEFVNERKAIAEEEERKRQRDLLKQKVKTDVRQCTCILAHLCDDLKNIYGVGTLDMR